MNIKLSLFFILVPLWLFCKGAPEYLPDGQHPRLHSPADLARLSNHYLDNDEYWAALIDLAADDTYDGMYAKALRWKADGNTTALNQAISYLISLQGPTDSNPTFTGANNYRWTAEYYMLTYDIVYDELTMQQRINVGDNLNEWAEYTGNNWSNPAQVEATKPDDTDQFYSTLRSYVMIGVVTYDNGSSTYDSSNTAAKANYLRTDDYLDFFMDMAVLTGFNWEGDSYNSHSKRYIFQAIWAVYNATGYSYLDKKNVYNSIPDNWVEWLNYMVPPNYNIDQCLTYGDADNNAKQLRPEHCTIASLLSLYSNYSAQARWWTQKLWDKAGTSKDDYSIYLVIWFDDDLTQTDPQLSFDKIWFSESTIGSTTKQSPLKMYYTTDFSSTATMFAITCPPYWVDHQQPDCGEFYYWRNGEKLIWQYRTYEAPFPPSTTHNVFQVYNETPSNYDFLPRAVYTRDEGSGYPSADVGITKYQTNGDNYVYVRLDMYGQYRPRWYIHGSDNYTETNPFVETAWRSVVVIGEVVFMHDLNSWNGDETGDEYRRHNTIWWTSSIPSKSNEIVSGTTPGGQYMYGHYLLPTDVSIAIIDDATSSEYSNCGSYNYPACADLHYSVRATAGTVREDENFLTIYYTKDVSGAKTVEYFGEDTGTSIISTHLGAIVYQNDYDLISFFSKDGIADNSINFTYTPTGSIGTKCIIADLELNQSYDIIVSGTSEKTINIGLGSGYSTDESGMLAFTVGNDNSISDIGNDPNNLRPVKVEGLRIEKIKNR